MFDYAFQYKSPDSKNWIADGVMGEVENQFVTNS
jgi:hypothetical protein